MTQETPASIPQIGGATPTKADRRRAAREAAANPEEVPANEDVAPEDTESQQASVAIGDVVRDYARVIADISKNQRIPPVQGVRLVEIVLQYDVQRRNLALQEVSLMQNQMPQFSPPPGAVPVTPEEAAAIQDGTHPDLNPEQE